MTFFSSILSRVVALQIAAVAPVVLAIPLALHWVLEGASNKFIEGALHDEAMDLAAFLRPDGEGGVTLDLPIEIRSLFTSPHGHYSYAVLDSSGQALFSSPNHSVKAISSEGAFTDGKFSRTTRDGALTVGIEMPWFVDGKRYWVQVAQDLSHRNVIIDDILATFLPNAAWIILLILLALLIADALIVRAVLTSVRRASNTAATIGPANPHIRLADNDVPAEIKPLVGAVNRAFERLEGGLVAQRDFTSDVAHELRSPLSVMRLRVDTLEPSPSREALRADVARMTRTVSQLLDIAELESLSIQSGSTADLHAVCFEVVGDLAILEISATKSIALTGVHHPVIVSGHHDALVRAVRNLVENAIVHTPPGASIEVNVAAEGVVRVLDDGPGFPEDKHTTVFRRFWRRDRKADRQGLGLAIVGRIAEIHSGTVSVGQRPGGGSVFTLELPFAGEHMSDCDQGRSRTHRRIGKRGSATPE